MASKPPLTDSLVAAAWIGDQAVAEPGCRWVHYRGSFYRSGGGIYEKMEDLAVGTSGASSTPGLPSFRRCRRRSGEGTTVVDPPASGLRHWSRSRQQRPGYL